METQGTLPDAAGSAGGAQATTGPGGGTAGVGGTGGTGGPGDGGCGTLEICNGLDDDCDGGIDSEDACGNCGFATYDEHAYLFCFSLETWDEAEQLCEAQGYHLVAIEDAEENTWIYGQAREKFNLSRWFIGLTDKAEEGEWRFPDGRGLTFQGWHVDEPNGETGENCAAMGLEDYADRWDDFGCEREYAFICEAGDP